MIDDIFKDVDADGDGCIDFEEFMCMMDPSRAARSGEKNIPAIDFRGPDEEGKSGAVLNPDALESDIVPAKRTDQKPWGGPVKGSPRV